MRPMDDGRIDELLVRSMPERAAHQPAIDLTSRAIARARASELSNRLVRLRRFQAACALVASVVICFVLWFGSTRVEQIQLALSASAESASAQSTSVSIESSASTSDNSDPYVLVLLPLLIAGVAFAVVRSIERPPGDFSPLMQF